MAVQAVLAVIEVRPLEAAVAIAAVAGLGLLVDLVSRQRRSAAMADVILMADETGVVPEREMAAQAMLVVPVPAVVLRSD